MSIIQEINDPPLAILLWQRFNDVHEWLRTANSRRPGLFGFPLEYDVVLTQAAHRTGVRETLGAIRQLLHTEGSHGQVAEMAKLCEKMGAWAGREGFIETSAMYYLLAARAAPRNQVLAYAAGRAERACARYHRAEQWFQRAVGLSRRIDDSETYASAYLGWGLLEEKRGNHAAAHERYTSALRAAKRGKLLSLAAAAHQNMVPLAAQRNDFDSGQAHIIAAYKLYGRDAAIVRLAADAAAFWGLFRHFQLARRVYAAVVERVPELPDRIQIHANIARASAALGDEREYARILAYINEIAGSGRHFPARVWVDLAHGAHSLGRTRLALDLAGRALEDARERGEQGTAAAARGVLGAIQTDSPPERNIQAPERLQRFASQMIKRVEELPLFT